MAAAGKRRHKSHSMVNYLGPSSELPVSDLPTVLDVLKKGQLLRERHMGYEKHFPVSQMALELVILVKESWRCANAKLVETPVMLSDVRIKKKIETNWDILLKINHKKKLPALTKTLFEERLDRLFDILSCSCPFVSCSDAKCSQGETCRQVPRSGRPC
jgi:hypothetical protein